MDEFSARQVEFHLHPDGTNFLRLRNPARYGDTLSEVRPLVGTVHAMGMPVSGFEVGRMYAGLRGVHPVVGLDEDGRRAPVGSVEVGIAMRDLLAFTGNVLGAEFALALAPELVVGVMWEDDIRAGLRWIEHCQCFVDHAYQSGGPELLARFEHTKLTPDNGYRIAMIDDRWYVVTRVSLRDQMQHPGARVVSAHAANVYIFVDRSDQVAQFRAVRARTLAGLALGYVLALLVAWLLLRRISSTEAALESEQRFRSALFMLSPDSVLVTDAKGVITETNPRFCEVTGYAPEEVIGQNARVLQSDNTPPEVYREMWSTLLAGEEWRGDLQNRRKDGSLYWEAHAVVPVRDARGEIVRFVSFQRDISERHEMERALSASERLYRSIHDNVEEAIFVIHCGGDECRYVGANPSHQRATGLQTGHIQGKRPQDVLPPQIADQLCRRLDECIRAKQTIRFEEALDLPAGHRHWLVSLTPVHDDSGVVELVVGLAVDLTDQKAAEEELRRLATTDVLTGLANRRYFLERAAAELVRVRRYAAPTAFVMLDIDHFKRINDTWGHATGDTVLRLLAGVLVENLRESDLVGRLGGEEFGVLLPQTDLEAAQMLTERLRAAVTEVSVDVGGELLRFSASFGLTLLHADDEDFDMPMARADAALYAAKFAGRNRVKWRIR